MTEPRVYLDDLMSGATLISGGNLPEPIAVSRVNVGSGLDVSVTGGVANITAVASPLDSVPRWRSMLSVDFLTASSMTIGEDGEVLVGTNWLSFVNQANVYSVLSRWSIATGTGLLIRANAAGTLFSTGALPEMRCLLAGYNLGSPLRCRVRYGSCYGSTDVRTLFGLRWTGADPAYCVAQGTSHDAGAGIESVVPVRTSDGTNVQFGAVDLGPASESGLQNVLGFTQPIGAGVVRPMLLELSDSIFGGWGTAQNTLVRSVYFDAAAGRIDRNFYGINNAWPTLTLGAEFTTQSASAGLVITGIQVDQFY